MKVEQKSFSLVLFSALFGFLIANVFGTFLTALRYYIVWDGFVVVGIVVFVEVTNLMVYKRVQSVPSRPSNFGEAIADTLGVSTLVPLDQSQRGGLLYTLVNSFKLGLLLGFFVEAFKVGS